MPLPIMPLQDDTVEYIIAKDGIYLQEEIGTVFSHFTARTEATQTWFFGYVPRSSCVNPLDLSMGSRYEKEALPLD
jgi:hypothetical protein